MLILATKHDIPPKDPDAKIVVDIDNAILGKDSRTYNQYAKDVRREYYMYSDAQFRE